MQKPTPTRAALRLQGLGAVASLLIFSAGMLLRLEPFASWYYPLAWWSFILAMDALVFMLQGHSFLWRDPRGFLALSILSVPVWLLFEAVNLAMQNWYYVGSSPSWLARWVGYTVAFATVLPGIMEATELVGALGLFPHVRVRPIQPTRRVYAMCWTVGIVCLLLPIALPHYGFPLIWLGLVFVLEPINHRWAQGSLLREWEHGSLATLVRLLLGGLICGFAWEMFNIRALSKWIYTVPFFEELKLFEMPLAGFLGFPPFAVECYVVVQFGGIFRKGGRWAAPRMIRWGIAGAATVGCLGMFQLLDNRTVNSLQPRLEDLQDMAPQEAALLRQAGVDRLDLWIQRPGTRARESLVFELLGLSPKTVSKWRQWAAMASLKGMGTGNLRLLLDAGVLSIKDLADQEPSVLGPRLRSIQQAKDWARQPPRDGQVRVWVREARRICAEKQAGTPPLCQ